ncbi:hypothetical protein Mgra_00000562 [Meloidogyne graminicola]|uniref:SPRY domain-containing protein n=1 Tax=Meloidogyne graminicola TaxID=189291 RepID=A0A8T0A482_9BILA|nr:hypothetical protein Mgra_00000562 [Meloidogyne graminicola]
MLLSKEYKVNNKGIRLYAKNSFNRKDCYSKRYSLFYYEVKMIKETNDYCCAAIGFNDKSSRIFLCNNIMSHCEDYQKFSWKDGDVFGCGVVFQPNKESNTIVFFTKNGNKISNPIFLEEIDKLIPKIGLKAISVEVNFGYDLATKPFIYDMKAKHNKEIEDLKEINDKLAKAVLCFKKTDKLALFVLIPNKIIIHETSTCCDKKCINTNLITGTCKFKYGYVNVRYNGKIKIFFIRGINSYVGIGLGTTCANIFLCNNNTVWQDNQKFSWKDGDVFGCGAIFKPNKESNIIVFFTKNGQKLHFILIPNKINRVSNGRENTCCKKKCINNNFKNGTCASKNGYVNIWSNGQIQYFLTQKKGKINNWIWLFAQNSFTRANCCTKSNNSLFYYEVKITKYTYKECYAGIGFDKEAARIFLNNNKICQGYQQFSWIDGDVFGCGVIFQSNKKLYTIVFFTKNGEKIGYPIFLEEIDELCPLIGVMACSIETNFGYDLAAKPFLYDVNKHFC